MEELGPGSAPVEGFRPDAEIAVGEGLFPQLIQPASGIFNPLLHPDIPPKVAKIAAVTTNNRREREACMAYSPLLNVQEENLPPATGVRSVWPLDFSSVKKYLSNLFSTSAL